MNYIHHFQLLIRSVYPIRYSISLITFFPNKPGIGDSIPICLGCCKIPTFGNNGTGRKDVDFSWRIGLKEWFTPFPLQECQLQEHGYLCSFSRYIQGFLYKFQGYLIRRVGNDSSIRVFGGFQEINATGTITTIYQVSGINLLAKFYHPFGQVPHSTGRFPYSIRKLLHLE